MPSLPPVQIPSSLAVALRRSVRYAGLAAAAVCLAAVPARALGIGFELKLSGNTNTPTIRLTNVSDADQITAFNFTIGDTAKNFDVVFSYTNPLGGTHTLLAPDVGDNGVRSDNIGLTFTGFDAGEFTQFVADIDRDSSPFNTVENYRTVFFNNGGLLNSVATVTFASGHSLALTLPDGSLSDSVYTFTAATNVPDTGSTAWLALATLGVFAAVQSRRRS